MLAHYEQQLLEKENSGCAALLRDDKVLPVYAHFAHSTLVQQFVVRCNSFCRPWLPALHWA